MWNEKGLRVQLAEETEAEVAPHIFNTLLPMVLCADCGPQKFTYSQSKTEEIQSTFCYQCRCPGLGTCPLEKLFPFLHRTAGGNSFQMCKFCVVSLKWWHHSRTSPDVTTGLSDQWGQLDKGAVACTRPEVKFTVFFCLLTSPESRQPAPRGLPWRNEYTGEKGGTELLSCVFRITGKFTFSLE